MTVADNDEPTVTVSLAAAAYAVTEGWTVDVTATLSADPEREVTERATAHLHAVAERADDGIADGQREHNGDRLDVERPSARHRCVRGGR